MQNNDFLNYILSPRAIREKARMIFELSKIGELNFSVDESKLDLVVDYVHKTILKNYPDLNIPFHSRWGHFRANGVNRELWLNEKIKGNDVLEIARIKLDLVITSVLLDAGAGDVWKYFEKETNANISRSEGLGVASFHMFMDGAFSSLGKLQADAEGLQKITREKLETAFQVTSENPLLGVEGRLHLLQNLGKALSTNKIIFKDGRPGNILDYMIATHGMSFNAVDLMKAVLMGLGEIWPGRISFDGVNLGDVWSHSKLGTGVDSYVPFHKLSQWLTYSLMEPMMEAGVKISGINDMTGLPEYRNGGLLIDLGLITLKDQSKYKELHKPESEIVIEWRALTVYFLDLIGKKLQVKMNKTPDEFPLCKVLEGGTWWAGRYIAREKRPGGPPPMNILSDGTVF